MHAAFALQTEGIILRRFGCTEAHHGRLRRRHPHYMRIVAIEHAHRIGAKDLALVGGVGIHVAVPVQMILSDIEHRRRIRLQAISGVQLETRQFQHPHLRQCLVVDRLAQHIQCRGTDIAGQLHRHAGALAQQSDQAGDGGLAIGAGNCDQLRRVLALGA